MLIKKKKKEWMFPSFPSHVLLAIQHVVHHMVIHSSDNVGAKLTAEGNRSEYWSGTFVLKSIPFTNFFFPISDAPLL